MKKMTLAELIERDGVSLVALRLGRSCRMIQHILRGDRTVSREMMLRARRAYREFSADRDLDVELGR